jgi:heme exporter protein B
MLRAFACALRQSLLCTLRKPAEAVTPLLFFLMVATLFPMGTGPDTALLERIAPGVLWVGALLASLLALPRLFEGDLADGTLEQMLLSPHPASLLVAGRIAAHWLACGLPLACAAPVIALQYGLEGSTLGILWGSLLPGTAIFSLLGAIGAALTLGGRGGTVLMALILMPLYVPVLILGAGAVAASQTGGNSAPHLYLLAALACAALALAPWASTAALRIALE